MGGGKKPNTGKETDKDKDTDKDKSTNKDTNTNNDMDKDKKFIPAVEYGVGGTQSFIDMLINPNLTDNQKINTGIEWFGMTEEQMEKMLEK
jgi:hypothetical protein